MKYCFMSGIILPLDLKNAEVMVCDNNNSLCEDWKQ